MIILAVHSGHDAAVAVSRDGVIVASMLKERSTRVKHAIGIDIHDILAVLDQAGCGPGDVDFCALTSTQDIEHLFFDPGRYRFEIGGRAPGVIPSPLWDTRFAATGVVGGITRVTEVYASPADHRYKRFLTYCEPLDPGSMAMAPSVEDFAVSAIWERAKSLAEIATTSYESLLEGDFRKQFHLPVTVHIEGREVPGALFSHHYAHAAYAYFESPFDSAAIISHDGGSTRRGYRAGMMFFARGSHLYPLTPHYLAAGWTYHEVGARIGFGSIGGSGKLMGLSSYGQPRLLDPDFIGNWYDGPRVGAAKHPEKWFDALVERGRELGYDMDPLCDTRRITEPINADIAASTQRLFELTMLRSAESLASALARTGVGSPNLCLGGGTALNCPANSQLLDEGPFERVFAAPGCDDSGLAIGAAHALYYAVMDHPRAPAPSISSHRACLGPRYDDAEIEASIARHAARLIVERPTNPARATAEALHGDRVVGWFEGRSEVGPRALGHRSLLADPTKLSNWDRVNEIKGRERWRPLAPSVLEEVAGDWFEDCPATSPFMLFTARVRGDSLPAVTHVDGTARIQTVRPEDGDYYQVIREFGRLSGIPVVLNTSLNGPKVPIVEHPDHAIEFLLTSKLDMLVLNGRLLRRRE